MPVACCCHQCKHWWLHLFPAKPGMQTNLQRVTAGRAANESPVAVPGRSCACHSRLASCRPLPLAQVASPAPGGAPVAPRGNQSLIINCQFSIPPVIPSVAEGSVPSCRRDGFPVPPVHHCLCARCTKCAFEIWNMSIDGVFPPFSIAYIGFVKNV